jgi:hypothetical protein
MVTSHKLLSYCGSFFGKSWVKLVKEGLFVRSRLVNPVVTICNSDVHAEEKSFFRRVSLPALLPLRERSCLVCGKQGYLAGFG